MAKAKAAQGKAARVGGTVKLPGAYKSKGVEGFRLYDEADYAVEFKKVGYTVDNEKHLIKVKYEMTILDGPVQEEDEMDPTGKRMVLYENVLQENHASFNPEHTYTVDRIKQSAVVSGVTVNKDDSFEWEEFAGKQAVVRIKHEVSEYKGSEHTSMRPATWFELED